MTAPDWATDVSDALMGLSLNANEADAIVILMNDGNCWSRRTDAVSDVEVASRLRELADQMDPQ